MSMPSLDQRVIPYTVAGHAALIARAATALCGHGHRDDEFAGLCGDGCAGYHHGWMLLQHLGLISGLASERGFMVEAIRALSAERPLRSVLIGGCADFGLLSVIHEALGEAVSAARITVADRCETPLALCRLYAGQMGFEVACRRRELQLDPAAGPFDLVLMHSLLSFCAPAERGALLAALASGLAPGGTLLAYQSIRPGSAPTELRYGEAEIETLIRQAAETRDAELASLGLSAAAAAMHIRAFCHAKTTISVPSIEGVVEAAEAKGLVVTGSRVLLDSRSSSHRAATPASRFLKYELRIGR